MKTGRDSCGRWLLAAVLCVMLSSLAWAQKELPDAPTPQNVPPPAQPAETLPKTVPPGSTRPVPPDPDQAQTAGPAPSDQIKTIPRGQGPQMPPSPRDQLFTLTKSVNFVLVPVTVKGTDGRLVDGLLPKDFRVYEDGVLQNLTFFTSDPFPLSAAVVLDTSLPDITWRKVRDTLSALVGAFSQFDELSIYTYGNTVQKAQDFTTFEAASLSQTIRNLKRQSGRMGGVPVVGGPMSGGPSPTINGRPVDPSVPHIATMPRESHVLNDAILRAAQDLSRRDPTRRRILFVISDGREIGSANGYADVLKVLLTRQISVYAVGVGGGIPGYRQLEKIRIPGQGYGNILPKYASATGGQVYSEVDQHAIEDAYARVIGEARNQYTIGYNARSTPSSSYRTVEVRVRRPNLKVYARDGYYPLPRGR